MPALAPALRRDVALRHDQLRLGLWMFLATVTMLFAGFTSAYIVRRSGLDWQPTPLPPVLWFNTVVLAASSMMLELSNRFGLTGRRRASTWAATGSLALGFVFLAGQLAAWNALRAAGVYVSTNPSSSFLYMMTGAHAVHVVAALAALASGVVIARSMRLDRQTFALRMELCRTFSHYLAVVWVFLFALLSLY